MLQLLLICCCLLPGDEPVKLGLGQPWYDQEKTVAQSREGILDYQGASGRIGVSVNYVPFRMVRKDADTGKVVQFSLHAPGFESLLALNVGQRVVIEGKLVSQGEGESKQEMLWVGKLQAMGPAPMNVFSDLKLIARTSKFQIHVGRADDGAAKFALRSAKEAGKVMGVSENDLEIERKANHILASYFGIATIDWKNQMVILVGLPSTANRPNFRKVEISKIEVHERGVTVYWKNEEGRAIGSPWVSDAVLVPRVDGEVTFKLQGKKPEGETSKTAPVEKKLIPQAPLK